MLYHFYQTHDDLLTPLRQFARLSRSVAQSAWWGPGEVFKSHFTAGMELIDRFELSHERPDFGIDSVLVEHELLPVDETVALQLPFARLLHFKKGANLTQPRVLIVAPLSGHFSTLLRGTVQTMLRDHDVYITDWANARDVPLAAGRFGVDEYIDYIIRFFEHLGPGAHALAVCQPCVQTLAAVAIMSAQAHADTPISMTLMGGPIDPRESPTAVNELAVREHLSWFEQNLIATVPARYPGAGRRVYPGFLQLTAFMSMNMERHRTAHRRLYQHLVNGETQQAETIKRFYDEYFAVLDLTEEFYIETLDRVFQRADLAQGNFHYRSLHVDPGLIRKTALLTVEGGRDDICALGQTAAAHDLCRSLRPHLKRHHLQANVGHYGLFNGKRWENEIYPVVRNLILSMA
ncbi:MAG: polyhydroxyalkanoate depolymerase [Gammaproteobacteria bacterium]|nr:polyhydroxyalkanoate depolymerase [Gammaproteobacteria bacterium]